MQPRNLTKYGWKRDLPDFRDHIFSIAHMSSAIPSMVDLRSAMPPVYDQGQLGSCTANATAAAFEYELKKQGIHDFMPSRLFIYYNERAMEGTVGTDAGAQIRDGIKSVNKLGVCSETVWPYKVNAFTHKPTPSDYAAALKNTATSYLAVQQTLDDMKRCLALGYPIVAGISVYDSFESDAVASSGIVPMPAKGEKLLGGHAVLCVGYDDATQTFIMRNSWGTGWGQSGYFTIPYIYLINKKLASDFWTIRLVS